MTGRSSKSVNVNERIDKLSDATGKIIFLNGVSSSGKSSIAERLLVALPDVFFHMGVDAFGAMRSVERTHELAQDALKDTLRRTRAGFHRAVAGMASAGNNVVVDYVLSEPWRLRDCLEVLEPFDVYFVGVYCSPEELVRREVERGDRPEGLAIAQVETVHAHGMYDLEVDTAAASTEECAAIIVREYAKQQKGRAFEKLAACASMSGVSAAKGLE